VRGRHDEVTQAVRHYGGAHELPCSGGARRKSSSPREETFAAAIATSLDAGTSDGEILLN